MRAWALVEQAAEYLDGEGRAEAKKLSRLAATLYAAESMRLTTRLMQIASWLLLQRAANSGEMSRDQVASEKAKVRLDTASAHAEATGWTELPKAFVDLVNRSLSLQALVRRMDDEIYGKNTVVPLPRARSPTRSPTRSRCSTPPSRAADSRLLPLHAGRLAASAGEHIVEERQGEEGRKQDQREGYAAGRWDR